MCDSEEALYDAIRLVLDAVDLGRTINKLSAEIEVCRAAKQFADDDKKEKECLQSSHSPHS